MGKALQKIGVWVLVGSLVVDPLFAQRVSTSVPQHKPRIVGVVPSEKEKQFLELEALVKEIAVNVLGSSVHEKFLKQLFSNLTPLERTQTLQVIPWMVRFEYNVTEPLRKKLEPVFGYIIQVLKTNALLHWEKLVTFQNTLFATQDVKQKVRNLDYRQLVALNEHTSAVLIQRSTLNKFKVLYPEMYQKRMKEYVDFSQRGREGFRSIKDDKNPEPYTLQVRTAAEEVGTTPLGAIEKAYQTVLNGNVPSLKLTEAVQHEWQTFQTVFRGKLLEEVVRIQAAHLIPLMSFCLMGLTEEAFFMELAKGVGYASMGMMFYIQGGAMLAANARLMAGGLFTMDGIFSTYFGVEAFQAAKESKQEGNLERSVLFTLFSVLSVLGGASSLASLKYLKLKQPSRKVWSTSQSETSSPLTQTKSPIPQNEPLEKPNDLPDPGVPFEEKKIIHVHEINNKTYPHQVGTKYESYFDAETKTIIRGYHDEALSFLDIRNIIANYAKSKKKIETDVVFNELEKIGVPYNKSLLDEVSSSREFNDFFSPEESKIFNKLFRIYVLNPDHLPKPRAKSNQLDLAFFHSDFKSLVEKTNLYGYPVEIHPYLDYVGVEIYVNTVERKMALGIEAKMSSYVNTVERKMALGIEAKMSDAVHELDHVEKLYQLSLIDPISVIKNDLSGLHQAYGKLKNISNGVHTKKVLDELLLEISELEKKGHNMISILEYWAVKHQIQNLKNEGFTQFNQYLIRAKKYQLMHHLKAIDEQIWYSNPDEKSKLIYFLEKELLKLNCLDTFLIYGPKLMKWTMVGLLSHEFLKYLNDKIIVEKKSNTRLKSGH